MKKIISLFIFASAVLLIGCGEEKKKDGATTDNIEIETTGLTQNEREVTPESETIVKKYPIKSGKITFDQKGVIGNKKILVYFDNFGTMERNETYDPSGKLEEIRFTDGNNMYKISFLYDDDKTAYIMGSGKFGTEMKFVTDPFHSEKDKLKYTFKPLANMDILGKDCEAYSTKISMGENTFAGWNNILLYSKTVTKYGNNETIAVEFEENIPVDKKLFKVPAGFTVKKM